MRGIWEHRGLTNKVALRAAELAQEYPDVHPRTIMTAVVDEVDPNYMYGSPIGIYVSPEAAKPDMTIDAHGLVRSWSATDRIWGRLKYALRFVLLG